RLKSMTVRMSIKSLAVFGFTIACLGCDQQGQTAKINEQPKETPSQLQRFLPIQNFPALALDTKTGQLCKTQEVNNSNWDKLPLCLSLYQE
ncbi:MAG: hypothetical protein WB711_24025, partial [Terriglobales bacterium]